MYTEILKHFSPSPKYQAPYSLEQAVFGSWDYDLFTNWPTLLVKEKYIFISICPTLLWHYKQKHRLFIFFYLIMFMKWSIQPPNLTKNRSQLCFFKKKPLYLTCSLLTSAKLNSANLHPNPWEHLVLSSHLDCIYITKKKVKLAHEQRKSPCYLSVLSP